MTENTIPMREYMEALVERMESTLKHQIDGLRLDIERLKQDYVTRAEFDTMNTTIQRELDRLERQHTERTRDTRDDLITRLGEFKEDIKRSNERTLVLWGIVIGIISIVAQGLIGILF